MYKIRTAEGNETVYDSLEEFSAAVRRGAVTPNDEIFHTRAGRWLDIKSHPHYRSALNHSNGVGGSPAGVGSAPPQSQGGSGPAPAPAPRQVQQTVYRHQLQPPVPKSKDLTFIDVDGTVVPPSITRKLSPSGLGFAVGAGVGRGTGRGAGFCARMMVAFRSGGTTVPSTSIKVRSLLFGTGG
jgi:hypothetical protein